MTIDPAWAGKVDFYELLYGTWLAYIFLVLMWEKVLKAPLGDANYCLLTLFGAGAFWINHYFQYAPGHFAALNGYTVVFLLAWWLIAVRGQSRSVGWKVAAVLSAIVYTVAFILFEQFSRWLVQVQGVNEFWTMLATFFGFLGVILWRRSANAATTRG